MIFYVIKRNTKGKYREERKLYILFEHLIYSMSYTLATYCTLVDLCCFLQQMFENIKLLLYYYNCIRKFFVRRMAFKSTAFVLLDYTLWGARLGSTFSLAYVIPILPLFISFSVVEKFSVFTITM